MRPTLQHDVKSAARFLRTLDLDRSPIVTLTAIHGDEPGTYTRSLDARDSLFGAELEAFLRRYGSYNLYYQVNAARASKRRKLAAEDIELLRGCVVDVDPDPDMPFHEARRQVIQLAADAADGGFASGLRPTYAVSSGSGVQLGFLFRKPLPATQSNIDLVEEFNRGLVQVFGGDRTTTSIANLFRLPGTVNWMRGKKTGRAPVLATALKLDTAPRYDLHDLELHLPEAPAPKREATALPKTKLRPSVLRQIKNALKHLDQESHEDRSEPFDYHTWLKVGFALHAETRGSQEGFELFDEWSARSGKYDADNTAALWDRIHDRDNRKLITGASLFHLAEEHGWFNVAKIDEPLPPWDHDEFDHEFPPAVGEMTDRERTDFEAVNDNDAADADARPHTRTLSLREMLQIGVYTPAWLIPGFLPERVAAVLWGMPGSLKTTAISFAAFCGATGTPWLTGTPLPKFGTLYLAMESAEHTRNMFHGFMKQATENGSVAADEDFPLMVHEEVLPLFSSTGKPTKGEEKVLKLVRQFNRRFDTPCKLIIVDTLARAMLGGEENDAGAVSILSAAVERIREATGAAVVLLHHGTKDGSDFRGSGAILGNFEGLIRAQRGKGDKHDTASSLGRLTVQRLKGVIAGKSLHYRSKPLQVGTYADGSPLETFILDATNKREFAPVREDLDADDEGPDSETIATETDPDKVRAKLPKGEKAVMDAAIAVAMDGETITTKAVHSVALRRWNRSRVKTGNAPTMNSVRVRLNRLAGKELCLAKVEGTDGVYELANEPAPPDFETADEV